MTANELPEVAANQVIVVYSATGGVPYIDLVTKDRTIAAERFNGLVVEHGKRLTHREAVIWKRENASFKSELKRINGEWHLAHTDDFDAYVEIVDVGEALDRV